VSRVVYSVYLGKGKFEVRAPNYIRDLDDTYRVGAHVKLTTTQPRSHKQLNYFFAWLREVFDNLPEDCPVHVRDAEHFRAWLLYKTGHAHVWSFDRSAVTKETVSILRRMSSKHLFFEATESLVFVYEPESIAMATMTKEAFTKFFNEAKELAEILIPGLDHKALEARAREGQD